MSKGVQPGLVRILADKLPALVLQPLGHADHHAVFLPQRPLHIHCKAFHIKVALGQINQQRIVPRLPARQGRRRGHPSRVPPHKFHNGDGLLLIHRRVQHDLPHRGGHVLGGAAVTRRVVRFHQVVVNGLGDADHRDFNAF